MTNSLHHELLKYSVTKKQEMKLSINLGNISLTKKLIILLIWVQLFFISDVFSQSMHRMDNPEYTQTVFFENFESDTLNRNTWNVASNIKKGDLFIFDDSTATVYQTNKRLDLTMIRSPGYSVPTWSPEGIKNVTANFVSGEVMTDKDFSYGIFECRATMACDKGSFPAFWLYSDAMCNETERPEIDIVELKGERRKPTLDNNIWYYPINCLPPTAHEFEKHRFSWGGTHTFKCTWTPEKIEFWVDSLKLKVVENTGQYWYPQLPQHVILSQQVIKYGRVFRCAKRIVTPQTSSFHWVKVREFFLTPEINCPDNIDLPVRASLDVDGNAKNITWELIPSGVFFGEVSGTGTTARISPLDYHYSMAKIIFKFEMPSGESFSAEKEFTLNGLH